MALSNADNPLADKPVPAKVAPKVEQAPKLARASESGDAGVHNLLAQRGVHESNGSTAAVEAIDAQLAELGFTV